MPRKEKHRLLRLPIVSLDLNPHFIARNGVKVWSPTFSEKKNTVL